MTPGGEWLGGNGSLSALTGEGQPLAVRFPIERGRAVVRIRTSDDEMIYGVELDDEDVSDVYTTVVTGDKCDVCGVVGACAWDIEGRALIHASDEEKWWTAET